MSEHKQLLVHRFLCYPKTKYNLLLDPLFQCIQSRKMYYTISIINHDTKHGDHLLYRVISNFRISQKKIQDMLEENLNLVFGFDCRSIKWSKNSPTTLLRYEDLIMLLVTSNLVLLM